MAASARETIITSNAFIDVGSFQIAAEVYYRAFAQNPLLKLQVETEFRDTIIMLCAHYDSIKKMNYIFNSLRRALKEFPRNFRLLNEIGKYFFKYGRYFSACLHFQQALLIEPRYVEAEKNINSLKNMMVDRWHFRMLNDKKRNQAYRAALIEKIKPYETTVLDLGAGTAILSMYASECDPLMITACDFSEVMAAISHSVLSDNKLSTCIIYLNKMSTSMDERDLGEKCSLLVTEIFDAGLFGEHALQSLEHAWKNLLCKNATIIPGSAEFFILGIDSKLLTSKYKLGSEIKSLLNIKNIHVHVATDGETYDSDDVYLYSDIKYMTEAASVVKVDFTDLNDIQEKLNFPAPYTIELKALEGGDINAYVGWFNLYLTENVTLTNDPRAKDRASAWQQALFIDDIRRAVPEGEVFGVNFLFNGGKLIKLPDFCDDIVRISPDTLRFLNDTEYVEMITNCVSTCCLYLGQTTEIAEISVVDLCPFPVFGFLMLKRNVRSLICSAKTVNDKEFIEKILHANDIELSRVRILVGEEWTSDVFRGQKYNAIFSHILELGGDIDIRKKAIGRYLKNNCLKDGGLFLPYAVSLMAQIVSSKWIMSNNRVSDRNIGYKVEVEANKHVVTQNFYLDLLNLEYTSLTTPQDFGDVTDFSTRAFRVPVRNSGTMDAAICWYGIQLMENLNEIYTKRPYSFMDGTAFIGRLRINKRRGDRAIILLCVDPEGSFKLEINIDTS